MAIEQTFTGNTEFGLWLRHQPEFIERKLYITNIDWFVLDNETEKWLLLEEKRYGWYVKPYQHHALSIINKACAKDKNYRGLHFINFENTNRADGRTQLNNKDISIADLKKFLLFDESIIKKYYDETDIIFEKLTPKIVDNVPKLKI